MQKMNLKRVDRELIEKARKAFAPTALVPSNATERAMYDAGVTRVLDWLHNEVGKSTDTTTVSNVPVVELPDSDEGFLRRIMRGNQ